MLPPKPWPYKSDPFEIPEPDDIRIVVGLALERGTSVSFRTSKGNGEIRSMAIAADPEGMCAFTKSTPDSDVVHVCPKTIHDEIFS